MRNVLSKSLAALLVLTLSIAAGAQERDGDDREPGDRSEREERGERGGRGRFGGGPGGPGFGGPGRGGEIGRLMLVRVEPVQEELGLVEEQITKIDDLRGEMRGGRGGRGERGDRPNFRDMSEEERQEFMAQRQKEAAERSAQEKEKLGEILMPHQSERLEQIFLQVRGAGALLDPAVAEQVGLTEDDQEKLREAIQSAREGMQDEMRALFESGDREQIGEKMREMQQKVEEEALAVLSDEQKQKLEELKGEKFDLPPDALRGAFGGGRGGRGGREGRPNRPQRPSTDEV